MHLHPHRAIGPAVIEKEQILSPEQRPAHAEAAQSYDRAKRTAPGPIQGRLLKKRIH